MKITRQNRLNKKSNYKYNVDDKEIANLQSMPALETVRKRKAVGLGVCVGGGGGAWEREW